jgi:hypothetical protein
MMIQRTIEFPNGNSFLAVNVSLHPSAVLSAKQLFARVVMFVNVPIENLLKARNFLGRLSTIHRYFSFIDALRRLLYCQQNK